MTSEALSCVYLRVVLSFVYNASLYLDAALIHSFIQSLTHSLTPVPMCALSCIPSLPQFTRRHLPATIRPLWALTSRPFLVACTSLVISYNGFDSFHSIGVSVYLQCITLISSRPTWQARSQARDDFAAFVANPVWKPPRQGLRSVVVRALCGFSINLMLDGNAPITDLKNQLCDIPSLKHIVSPALVVAGKQGLEDAFDNDSKSIANAFLEGEAWLLEHYRAAGLFGGARKANCLISLSLCPPVCNSMC